MNGITEIRMRKIQSRTRQYRRRYEWREISCLTVCSLFLLAGIGIFAWAHTGTGDIFCGRRLRRGSAAKRSRSVCDHWHGLFYSLCGDDDHLYPLEEEKMAIHRIRKKVRNEYEKAIEQNAQYPADMQHGDDADAHNRFCDEP